MLRPAPRTLRQKLAEKNRLYLSLLSRYNQECRIYNFSPELKAQIAKVRDEIVLLQQKLPKGGEPKPV